MCNHLCVRRYNVDEINTVNNKALMYICVCVCVHVCACVRACVRARERESSYSFHAKLIKLKLVISPNTICQ